MKVEKQKLLVQAWELEHKILKEIEDLAEMNYCLAYGCIRTAETMIDFIAVAKMGEAIKKGKEVNNGEPRRI